MLYNNVRDVLSTAARYAADFRGPVVVLTLRPLGIEVKATAKVRTFIRNVDRSIVYTLDWERMDAYVGDSLILDTIDDCVEKLYPFMSEEEKSAWRIIKHVWGCR